jgi:hypothetical protein
VISGQHRTETATPPPSAGDLGAAPARPSTVAVLIESIPSGATVLSEDGKPIGVTPVSWTVATNSNRVVTFRKSGFVPIARRFLAAGDSTLAVHMDTVPDDAPNARRAAGKPLRRSGATAATRETIVKLDSAAATIDPFSK